MNKSLLLLILWTISPATLYAQSLSPQLLSTAGSCGTQDTLTMSWSIGETFTQTYILPEEQLTQGFQQPNYFIETAEPATVNAHLFCWLEGPYNSATKLMNTHLRDNLLVSATQPFNEAPWHYTGTESVVNNAAIPKDVVDWVLVEIRDAVNNGLIIEQRAVFLYADGHLSNATNGCPNAPFVFNKVTFCNLTNNESYYLIIRHRNHLDVMSAHPITVTNHSFSYDFRTALTQAYGTAQLVSLNDDSYGLLAGDITGDGVFTISDYNYYATESSMLNGYFRSDVNLDKSVSVNDFNWYQSHTSVIGTVHIRY